MDFPKSNPMKVMKPSDDSLEINKASISIESSLYQSRSLQQ